MLRPISWISLGLLFLVCLLAGPFQASAAEVDLGVITVKQKVQAEALRQRLLKGDSFEALAREYSVGPAASRGGRLGLVPDARLRAEYRQALPGLRPGTPSQVILTEDGYNILMRFDAQPAPAAPQPVARPAQPAPVPAPPSGKAAQTTPQQGPVPDMPQLAARQAVVAGLEAMAAGKQKEAEGHFSKALGLNPREDSAAFLLEVIRVALAGKVNAQASAAFAEGFLGMVEPNTNKALQGFRKASQLDPGFWHAQLMEATILAGMGNHEEATKVLQKVLQLNPRAERAYVTLGMVAMDERKLEEGVSYFRKALEINPELAEAHYRLGNYALYKGNFAEAEREYTATLAIDPFRDEAHNDLGLVYAQTGRFQEAEKSYRKALELNPAYPAPHINLGTMYAQTGRLNAALDEFNEALLINPRLIEAHINLAAAYIMKEDWPKAISHADMVNKLGGQVPEVILRKLASHRK